MVCQMRTQIFIRLLAADMVGHLQKMTTVICCLHEYPEGQFINCCPSQGIRRFE